MISPGLVPQLLLPIALMGLTLYVPALVIWYRQRQALKVDHPLSQNPLELRVALLFGALLALIMVLGEWLRELLGEAGIYLLAASSGLADVDAITLSLSRMSLTSIDASTAVLGIIIAAAVNNLVKAGMATAVGTRPIGRRVAVPMLLSLAVGLTVAWLA